MACAREKKIVEQGGTLLRRIVYIGVCALCVCVSSILKRCAMKKVILLKKL